MRFVILPALLGLAACHAIPPDSHSSQNSLDWAGEYRGTVPCADCEGIDTIITLASDRTYELTTRYLGKSHEPGVSQGSFEWRQAGAVIALRLASGERLYRVEENRLRQLDQRGERITGSLADKYVLSKVTGTGT